MADTTAMWGMWTDGTKLLDVGVEGRGIIDVVRVVCRCYCWLIGGLEGLNFSKIFAINDRFKIICLEQSNVLFIILVINVIIY